MKIDKLKLRKIFVYFIPLIIFSFNMVYLLPFYNLSAFTQEEVNYLSWANRVLKGELMYKDFFSQDPPGLIWYYVLWLKLFGMNSTIGRMFTVLTMSLTVVVIYSLARFIVPVFYAVLASSIFISWEMHWRTVTYNAREANLLALTSILFICYYISSGRLKWILLSGIMAGLSMLFKQNIGTFIILSSFTFFISTYLLRNKNINSGEKEPYSFTQPKLLFIVWLLCGILSIAGLSGAFLSFVIISLLLAGYLIEVVEDERQPRFKIGSLKRFSKVMLYYISGIFMMIIPVLIYFFSKSALTDMIYHLLIFPFTVYRYISHVPSYPKYHILISMILFLVLMFIVNGDLLKKTMFSKYTFFKKIIETRVRYTFLILSIGGVVIYSLPHLAKYLTSPEPLRSWINFFNHFDTLISLTPIFVPFASILYIFRSYITSKTLNPYIMLFIIAGLFLYLQDYPWHAFLTIIWGSYFSIILGSWLLFKVYKKSQSLTDSKFINYILSLVILIPLMILLLGVQLTNHAKMLSDYTSYLNIDRGKLYLKPKETSVIKSLVKYIKRNTLPNEEIFIFPIDGYSIYFLTNRRNPTRYEIFLPETVRHEYQKDAISSIVNSQVRYIILDGSCLKNNYYTDTTPYHIIYNYIIKNYKREAKFGEYIILKKMSEV